MIDTSDRPEEGAEGETSMVSWCVGCSSIRPHGACWETGVWPQLCGSACGWLRPRCLGYWSTQRRREPGNEQRWSASSACPGRCSSTPTSACGERPGGSARDCCDGGLTALRWKGFVVSAVSPGGVRVPASPIDSSQAEPRTGDLGPALPPSTPASWPTRWSGVSSQSASFDKPTFSTTWGGAELDIALEPFRVR